MEFGAEERLDKVIRGIIAILKGKQTPAATAFGIALGAMLGLIPKDNLFPYLFFILFFLTTIDKPAALMASILFTPVGWALDGLAEDIGTFLLQSPPLQGLWTWIYNAPVLPWTNFNNTVVMGQLAIGAILFIPLFFLSKKLVSYYQLRLKPSVDKWPLINTLKGFRAYQWWESIRQD